MPAVARNNNRQQIIQQMAQAQIAMRDDNEKLRAIMKTTLEAFAKYCRKMKSIPHSERHVEYLERSLSELAGTNPFNEFPFRIAADDQSFATAHDTTGGDRKKLAIFIRLENSLNAAKLAAWQKSKTANWVEMPGSITILHDGLNSCCLWGAGVDGLPIKVDDNVANSDNFVIFDDHVVH